MAQAKGCFIGLPRVAPGLPNVPNMEAYRVKASPTAIMLKKGDYGVEEPEPEPSLLMAPEQFIVAFVPGLLFDRSGMRLGRGGGHFDCFLSRCNPTCVKIGLGYSWQLTEDPLPREQHDIAMDMLLIGGELIDLRVGMKADPA
jgi:5-formyltetrahydrofolate cyclo-ligase